MSDYSDGLLQRPAGPRPGGPLDRLLRQPDPGRRGRTLPQACLPGGGWRIKDLAEHEIEGVGPDGGSLRVNRVEIALGEERQLVYYWFAQRGRNLTSEYLVKWYIFQDGLTHEPDRRRPGAHHDAHRRRGEPLQAGDARLEAFVRDIDPKLAYYLPGADAAPRAGDFPGLASAAAGVTAR